MRDIAKDEIKDYLTSRWDVKLAEILEDLKLSTGQEPFLIQTLDQLEAEGWIIQTYANKEQREYCPGPAQNQKSR